jgi:glycosyltransferase involved in cell wall biosynthesis
MIKVLHVVESFGGGTLRLLATLCRATEGAVDAHVLHGNRDEGASTRPDGFPSSVSFTPWPVGRSVSPRADARAIGALKDTVARLAPDLVHAHSSKAGALVRLAFPDGGLPVVYSPHCYAFQRRDIATAMRAAYWGIERLLGLLPHVTVACGLAEYGSARLVSRSPVYIPNMVDLAAIDGTAGSPDARRPGGGGALRIGTAGGIRPQKNFPLYCAIAAALEDTGMTFVWVGGGDIPPTVTVPANLEVTGWQSHAGALARLAACDVYVQTSLWEGLSIAILEGMALGLPILTTPAPGNPELVIEGHNGFLCASAAGFVQRLRQLDSDRTAVARMGAASRRLIGENYAIERVAPRWISLYQHYRRYSAHETGITANRMAEAD